MTKLTRFTESITNDPSMTVVFADSCSSLRVQDCDGWKYAIKLSSESSSWGPKRWNTKYRRREWMKVNKAQ
jgi:hypothetical protein